MGLFEDYLYQSVSLLNCQRTRPKRLTRFRRLYDIHKSAMEKQLQGGEFFASSNNLTYAADAILESHDQPRSRSPAARASSTPLSVKSTSVQPVNRFSLFQVDSPWRSNTILYMGGYQLARVVKTGSCVAPSRRYGKKWYFITFIFVESIADRE